METFASLQSVSPHKRESGMLARIDRVITGLPRVFVPLFALLFFAFAVCLAVSALVQFAQPIIEDGDFVQGLVKGLHTGVVALAVYELAQIVHQEYDRDNAPQNIMDRIRRGVARFGSVVFVALVLESLIMVIKYSQQDLAGFLYYPAAIIVGAALLLVALGLFVRFTAGPAEALSR
jgi:hypothetical protein